MLRARNTKVEETRSTQVDGDFEFSRKIYELKCALQVAFKDSCTQLILIDYLLYTSVLTTLE